MNALTLSHLLRALGGGESVTAFFLVLARVSPLFILAPFFSSKMIPVHVRGIAAVGLSIGLAGVASHGQRIPTDAVEMTTLMVEQVLVGTLLSFVVAAADGCRSDRPAASPTSSPASRSAPPSIRSTATRAARSPSSTG